MKNETEKVCPCGRIITDPNNKTGLCPKCKKIGNNFLGMVGLATLGVGLKKIAPRIVKGAIKLIKK